MYNFDPYKVLLSIATNIPVLLMTAFVLYGHIYIYYIQTMNRNIIWVELVQCINALFVCLVLNHKSVKYTGWVSVSATVLWAKDGKIWIPKSSEMTFAIFFRVVFGERMRVGPEPESPEACRAERRSIDLFWSNIVLEYSRHILDCFL